MEKPTAYAQCYTELAEHQGTSKPQPKRVSREPVVCEIKAFNSGQPAKESEDWAAYAPCTTELPHRDDYLTLKDPEPVDCVALRSLQDFFTFFLAPSRGHERRNASKA